MTKAAICESLLFIILTYLAFIQEVPAAYLMLLVLVPIALVTVLLPAVFLSHTIFRKKSVSFLALNLAMDTGLAWVMATHGAYILAALYITATLIGTIMFFPRAPKRQFP